MNVGVLLAAERLPQAFLQQLRERVATHAGHTQVDHVGIHTLIRVGAVCAFCTVPK